MSGSVGEQVLSFIIVKEMVAPQIERKMTEQLQQG